MKSYISINSKILGKLLKRYKLTTIGIEEILIAVQKRSSHLSIFNVLTRKIEFRFSNINNNK